MLKYMNEGLAMVDGDGCGQADATLWYDTPAADDAWGVETLPLGNGRLGCMLFGGALRERLQFNVDSLWTGDENPTGNYKTMGSYQNFGDLLVELRGEEGAEPSEYRRSLDLMRGLHTVAFRMGGAVYRRETFASAPGDVIVMRMTAEAPGSLTGEARLVDAHGQSTLPHGACGMGFDGSLDNGLGYAARIAVVADGGTASVDNGVCRFAKCSAVTIILAAATDYVPDCRRGWKGESAGSIAETRIGGAVEKTYNQMRKSHCSDVASIMQRMTLQLGESDPQTERLPTDKRLVRYAGGEADAGLEALLFQYGRYLLQASSRPGTLPPNLQGIWNDSNTPAFHCDYHTNINIQMNYWPAEAANLPECHAALVSFIQSQREAWMRATQAEGEFRTVDGTTPGWGLRVSHNIFGGLGWRWDKTASAWYCLHLWEHYAYGRDRLFLAETAYPFMKEVCMFLMGQLKAMPDGSLAIPMGWSPEHGPDEDGVSYHQQIAWELFNATVAASAELDVDAEFRTELTKRRDSLAGPRIGCWGQLQEWAVDRDDKLDRHRHTSHLFAVYPGTQITVEQTPDLAAAARVSLEARSVDGSDKPDEIDESVSVSMRSAAEDSFRSWTWPWRCALWARFKEPERAYAMVRGLLSYNVLPDLLTTHPPFQIDGNLGIAGAMCEMLVQSHLGWIELLPALPQEWKDGHVEGLRVRGGFEVAMRWRDGMLESAAIRATAAGRCEVRVGGVSAAFSMRQGECIELDGNLKISEAAREVGK